ncbi:MAG: hypothetical protein ED559_10210 [Phycisphaera sp.]|nr:MAG: hypothetical protein ED559_10210 [Phycisphaera sp.]
MLTMERECEEAVGRLRAALISLYDSVGADPASPLDVSRSLLVNKTLSYNMAKLLQQSNGLNAIPHVPGTSAIERFLSAATTAGADKAVVEEVRNAQKKFEQVISEHVGDRATLDLVIDGLAAPDGNALEQSRKRAFQGNSGIYGVQAAANVMSCFLAPNHDNPDQLDMVMLRGLVGVRRLRPTVRVPIFRLRQWSSSGQAVGEAQWKPLESDAPSPFLQQFSSGDVPEIDAVEVPGGVDYVVRPGPIGNKAAFDCFFGESIHCGASRFVSNEDKTGEFGVTITVPTERLIFDLIVHRDLDFAMDAKTFVYAYFFTQKDELGEWDESSELPIQPHGAMLSGSPLAVATARVPRYAEANRMVYDRQGWSPRDFVGRRVELNYPPLGSTVVQRFDLPER